MLETLFGNQTLVQILQHLSEHDSVCSTSLARELQCPVNMVQKQIAKLEKGTWVVPAFEGNRKVYYWNNANPQVPFLRRLIRKTPSNELPLKSKPQDDPAYGLHLPIKERIRLSEELTSEGELLSRQKQPKPFVKTFDSVKDYEKWKKRQSHPWLI